MLGFINQDINEIVQNDIFNKLSKYIGCCCKRMNDDLLVKDEKVLNDENKIKNHLLECYLDDDQMRKESKMEMFRFIPEIPEGYSSINSIYKGRVDVKIIHQKESFGNRKAAYFIECKRVDGRKTLNRLYVEEGISRFVTDPPHYYSHYRRNFMLGFVVENIDIHKNIERIESIQAENPSITCVRQFTQVNLSPNHYDSYYLLRDTSIQLRHIFADFSFNLVKKRD